MDYPQGRAHSIAADKCWLDRDDIDDLLEAIEAGLQVANKEWEIKERNKRDEAGVICRS